MVKGSAGTYIQLHIAKPYGQRTHVVKWKEKELDRKLTWTKKPQQDIPWSCKGNGRTMGVNRMDDLISRQALLESIERISVKGNVLDDDWVYRFIQEFPYAQQWIPCSERLPAYGEDVFLSIGKYCNVGYLVAANDETDGEWYYSGWYHPMYDVSAWMPLPDPYKEGNNG